MMAWLQRHAPWLAGFVLSVNVYPLPTVPASPRATDLIGILLAVVVLVRLVRGRQALAPLVLLSLIAAWPAGWLLLSLLEGDVATVAQAGRWLVAIPWAVVLLAILDDHPSKERFAWGLVWGGAVNMAVVLLQHFGFEGYLRLVGLSSSQSAFYHLVGRTVRLPGLHGHHASTCTVVSLVVPAGLYLYFRHRCSLAVLLAMLLGFFVTLHLSSTRSPLVISVVTAVYAFLAARQVARGVIIAAVLVGVLGPLLAVYGPPGGWSRWRDTSAITVNAGERVDTTRGAAVLSLEHPLGLGVTRGKETLYDAVGGRATHNAFLQASLFLGLPLGLAVLAAVAVVALRGLGGRDGPFFLEGLIAVQMAGAFMFEEHLNNPTFVILVAWLMVTAVRVRRSQTDVPDLAP